MAYPFRNLVFEGGGVKGSAYIGAIRALNEEGFYQKYNDLGVLQQERLLHYF